MSDSDKINMLAALEGINLKDYIDYKEGMSTSEVFREITNKLKELRAIEAPYKQRAREVKGWRSIMAIENELAATGVPEKIKIYNKLQLIVSDVSHEEFQVYLKQFHEHTLQLIKINDFLETQLQRI